MARDDKLHDPGPGGDTIPPWACPRPLSDETDGEIVFVDLTSVNALSRRQKIRRGLVTLLVVALALFFVAGGPSAVAATLAQRGQVAHAIPKVPTFPMYSEEPAQRLRLPQGAVNTVTTRIEPVNGNSGEAFACWASAAPDSQPAGVSLIHLALTRDGGHEWTDVPSPLASGFYCDLTADSGPTDGIVAEIYAHPSQPPQRAACTLPSLFYRGGAASGSMAWQPVAWPANIQPACGVRLALIGTRLYAWASQPLVPPMVDARALLITTADLGRTWQAGDSGLREQSSLTVLGVRPGGAVLAQTDVAAPTGSFELWQSADAGAHWRNRGPVPGTDPQVFVSSETPSPFADGWGPLYEIAQSVSNGAAQGEHRQYIAVSTLGAGWTPLPDPPLPQTWSQDPLSGLFEGIAVGPGGSLLIDRGVPGSGRIGLNPARYLWLWDPRHRAWLQSPNIQQANSFEAGIAWDRDSIAIWSTVVELHVVEPVLQLHVRAIPARYFVSGQSRRVP